MTVEQPDPLRSETKDEREEKKTRPTGVADFPDFAKRRKSFWSLQASPEEIQIELTRKLLHLLIAFVPTLLSFSREWTIAALAAGTSAYALFEYLRMHGKRVPLVSSITEKAARKRDSGKFVKGPITLGLGALCSVLLFSPEAASIAIYILAFGDGFSSLVGKTIGHIKLPLTRGKSLEGSITCFALSFLSALLVSWRPGPALVIALCSTVTEAWPTKDWDNIILPLMAGLTATLFGI